VLRRRGSTTPHLTIRPLAEDVILDKGYSYFVLLYIICTFVKSYVASGHLDRMTNDAVLQSMLIMLHLRIPLTPKTLPRVSVEPHIKVPDPLPPMFHSASYCTILGHKSEQNRETSTALSPRILRNFDPTTVHHHQVICTMLQTPRIPQLVEHFIQASWRLADQKCGCDKPSSESPCCAMASRS